jgi:hypothetical protein
MASDPANLPKAADLRPLLVPPPPQQFIAPNTSSGRTATRG